MESQPLRLSDSDIFNYKREIAEWLVNNKYSENLTNLGF